MSFGVDVLRMLGGLQEALEQICATLGESQAAAEIRELWSEYEAGSTEEAKLVKVCWSRLEWVGHR